MGIGEEEGAEREETHRAQTKGKSQSGQRKREKKKDRDEETERDPPRGATELTVRETPSYQFPGPSPLFH